MKTIQVEHKPNSLIQELYVSSQVDEVGGFGKKGWGKSWSILHECVHDIQEKDFSAVIFRRTSTDFEDLWNKARIHFAGFDPDPNETKHTFTFPSGARLKFAHLQHIKDVFTYNGQEYQLIVFDELPQFPMMPYLFMFSCLRGTNPRIQKRIRATGNPMGEGMLQVKARFFDQLKPTIVTDAGEIIKGDVGWFKSFNNRDMRASKEIERDLFQLCKEPDWAELKSKDPILAPYLSREWFFGERSHNVDLMKGDPGYEARLDQLPEKEKRAFKYGIFEVTDQEDQLISAEWWEAAINGKNAYKPGKKAFGIDYAEMGKDKSVNVEGEGNRPYKVQEWDYVAHPEMARIIRDDIYGQNGKFQIHGGLDTVGTGAGVYTSLIELGDVFAERTDPIRYKDPEFDAKYDAAVIKYHFNNIQDQVMWKLREDFQAGDIDLSMLTSPDHFYDNMHLLQEEVLAFWFDERGGKIAISPANDLRKPQRTNKSGMVVPCLGRSPDRAKALAIWNWCRNRPPKSPRNKFLDNVDYNINQHTRKKPVRRVMGI